MKRKLLPADLSAFTTSELSRAISRIESELWKRRKLDEQRAEVERARTLVHSRTAEEYVKCGKPGCHCAEGQGHGPYFYAYDTFGDRKVRKRYLGKGRPKGKTEPVIRYKNIQAIQRVNSRDLERQGESVVQGPRSSRLRRSALRARGIERKSGR